MSKMTVIQLLNKIANEEEVPKKIIADDNIYYYDETEGNEFYRYRTNGNELLTDYTNLNDEVEIIEDTPKEYINVCGTLFTKSEYEKLAKSQEDKKINKVDITGLTYDGIIIKFAGKINEIIDRLNGE